MELVNTEALDNVMTRTVDRRAFVRRALVLGAAGVLGGKALIETAAQASAASGHYRTTSSVNFRSGPSTKRRVLKVLPANTLVSYQGATSGAWLKVAHDGTIGWVHGDFLTESNGGSNDQWPVVGTAVTTDSVNLRSGPTSGSKVLRVVPRGTSVQITDNLGNGYRSVIHDGLAGWIYDDYLDGRGNGPRPEGYLMATAALNLRSKPDTRAGVIAVIPKGGLVQRSDVGASGFAYVAYNGNWGWAHQDYLK